MNIPARYVTGYLGDIGVPPAPYPMDFSAWMEVFLDGRWCAFDPRHNRRRIGRVVVARGRDATDVALTTVFGKSILEGFSVMTAEVSGDGLGATISRNGSKPAALRNLSHDIRFPAMAMR